MLATLRANFHSKHLLGRKGSTRYSEEWEGEREKKKVEGGREKSGKRRNGTGVVPVAETNDAKSALQESRGIAASGSRGRAWIW